MSVAVCSAVSVAPGVRLLLRVAEAGPLPLRESDAVAVAAAAGLAVPTAVSTAEGVPVASGLRVSVALWVGMAVGVAVHATVPVALRTAVLDTKAWALSVNTSNAEKEGLQVVLGSADNVQVAVGRGGRDAVKGCVAEAVMLPESAYRGVRLAVPGRVAVWLAVHAVLRVAGPGLVAVGPFADCGTVRVEVGDSTGVRLPDAQRLIVGSGRRVGELVAVASADAVGDGRRLEVRGAATLAVAVAEAELLPQCVGNALTLADRVRVGLAEMVPVEVGVRV